MNFCVVAGSTSLERPLVEVYDNSHWSRDVLRRTNDQLDAVSCAGPGECIAAGSPQSFSRVPIMSWALSHGRWRWIPFDFRLKVPYGPPDVFWVGGISCVDGSSCELAGGYSYGGPGGGGFIEHFDGHAWQPDEVQRPSRGGFDAVSCVSSGLCAATEDQPWAKNDSDGLSGVVVQIREDGRWVTLGRGLPAPDQLVVAAAGTYCFRQGWCVAAGGSNTGMFLATETGGHLHPFAVIRGVRLPRSNPYLEGLSCARPSVCVEGSESAGAPFVLVGQAG